MTCRVMKSNTASIKDWYIFLLPVLECPWASICDHSVWTVVYEGSSGSKARRYVRREDRRYPRNLMLVVKS